MICRIFASEHQIYQVMKKIYLMIAFLLLLPWTTVACSDEPSSGNTPVWPEQPNLPDGEESDNENEGENMETRTIKLKISGKTFTATLVDNSSTQALKALLAKGDLTIRMEDYARMEKVGPIGTTLPRNDEQISTGPGDLILYQGRYFVIYYGRNNYSLTRLGKIDNVTESELKDVLGDGDVTVTLSLGESN